MWSPNTSRRASAQRSSDQSGAHALTREVGWSSFHSCLLSSWLHPHSLTLRLIAPPHPPRSPPPSRRAALPIFSHFSQTCSSLIVSHPQFSPAVSTLPCPSPIHQPRYAPIENAVSWQMSAISAGSPAGRFGRAPNVHAAGFKQACPRDDFDWSSWATCQSAILLQSAVNWMASDLHIRAILLSRRHFCCCCCCSETPAAYHHQCDGEISLFLCKMPINAADTHYQQTQESWGLKKTIAEGVEKKPKTQKCIFFFFLSKC